MTDHAFPEVQAFGFAAVQANDWFWKSLFSSQLVRNKFVPYAVDGIQRFHILDLPESYDMYLSQFNSKKRYNFRRQERILRELGGGRLELTRVQSPDDVDDYLKAISAISALNAGRRLRGRQVRIDFALRNRLRNAAERGLLAAYLLTCGEQVIGCIRGGQYLDTYHVDSMLYRFDYSRFSVGATMLSMAIEDLIEHSSVRRLIFGFGEPDPTHHRTNRVLEYASVLLLRKTAMNRLAWLAHLSFRSAVRSARALFEWAQSSQFIRPGSFKIRPNAPSR
jgi:hypothetical protein